LERYGVPSQTPNYLLEKAGIKEDPQKPGLVPWADIPHFLWRNRLYITGLPEKLVLGDKSFGKVVQEPWDPSSHWHDHETPQLLGSLRTGKVKLAPRPAGKCVLYSEMVADRATGRNVVFEVFSEKGRSTDIGQWRERKPSSPAESDVPSDIEMDTYFPPESTDEDDDRSPLVQWQDEVNDVVDQLSDMLGLCTRVQDHCITYGLASASWRQTAATPGKRECVQNHLV
jgi:hypothetical protein